jgi:type I restriction-modification system DNA methylase subunit
MPAPREICDLVDRFAEHADAYRSGAYNETQLRREFVDPMFKALGWDMDNLSGYAEAYKDVIHEDAIKIGGATKAPDYCFRIGGTRKFFLEAKKPSVDINRDAPPAFQLRRYAWSAKLPLSILTDFEEFAVYDCRVKPVLNDKAGVARVFYLGFNEYVSRWDEIETIFSREAILKGSFDKFAESNKAKRGTAQVDDAFLGEIENWRADLARNLASRNPQLSQRDLNFSVQRTIDRIVFLRICEDRRIEVYGRLQALLNGEHTYDRMRQLFRQADERYNSGLFHFQKEKNRIEPPDDLTPGLEIDDAILKKIIKRLYYPESPYEFSVLSADILGQVYEQFLGKVIRLTEGHQAKIEDKPEVKKAGGVYYTPTYIVDYIVKSTVGKLLENKTPKQAAKLRILDPACGSGSFLIGAYQYLLDWHRDWFVIHEPKKRATGRAPVIYQASGGEWKLTTTERKRILLQNIFGVDIDAQAVETTKLSLLLKVLEGESEQSLATQLRFFHERALPDLGRNIKCGNSLIGPDFYEQSEMGLLDEEDRYRTNVFDWHSEFPEIIKAGGFDAVIGNPPYGAYFYDEDKEYLKAKYPFQTYQLDSYLLFLEKAVRDLLREGGFYGMIIPNPWLTNLLQTSVRRFVVQKTRVHSIVHFKFPVFPKVVVDTEILVLEKTKFDRWDVDVSVVDKIEFFLSPALKANILHIKHSQQEWQELDGDVINIFLTQAEKKLAAKCKKLGVRLDSFYEINVGVKPYQVGKGTPPQTREIVDERPFDSDRKESSSYRPYLRGMDIGRFNIAPLQTRFLRYGPWLAEPRPAAKFDAPEKIFMRQTGDRLVAALDREKRLCLNNMHVLVPIGARVSTSFLLGLINSTLLNWYYRTLNPEVGEALAEVKRANVAKLPIRDMDLDDRADKVRHDHMVELVERMLELHSELNAAKTTHAKINVQRQITATDALIDKLVCELYELTPDEVKVVEGAGA